MTKKQLLPSYKIAFAVLVLVTIVAQLSHSLQQSGFSIVNFFSYFTIESNLFGVTMLLLSAYYLVSRKKPDTQLDSLRGAATLYMVVTGIVYNLLLAHINVQITLPWVNTVLHQIFPVVMLLDWLIDPPKRTISTKQALRWLSYPLLYAAYTLIRGPLAHRWYPYPFINAAQHGYARVLLNCVVLAITVFVLAVIVRSLPKLTRAKLKS
ncbi:MAG TPA: Pr6Pr family membrane protein [Verrucomicrobiae bacterium]|nr:Pr6Pr family membrane protein [Verrucomicrobiae bacterium]